MRWMPLGGECLSEVYVVSEERTSMRRVFYEVYVAYVKRHSPHKPYNPNKPHEATVLRGALLISPTNILKALSSWRLSPHEGHKPLKDALLINPLSVIKILSSTP